MGDPALSRRRFLAASAGAGLGMTTLGACGGSGSGSGTTDAEGRTVVEWWNITTTQPAKGVWADLARAFEAKNPSVRLKVVTLENEAYKAKLTALTASGKLPDVFHTWGGGVLRQQVDAGLVGDLTDRTAAWTGSLLPVSTEPYAVQGKAYGIPFDIGMVGFWYNKALFAKAGIGAPPATWSGFLDAVRRLKTSGVTPLALAGKEKWPGMYYWAYLAMRTAGASALQEASDKKDFGDAAFVDAGRRLKELVALEPFQRGFLGAGYSTPGGQAATVGNGKAAMELMGQWAPSVQNDAGQGLGGDLGFFPFPEVEGGRGARTEVFGGGGGHAVRAGAPQAALDFLEFFTSADSHRRLVAETGVVPVVKEAADALKDANLKAVSQALSGATGFQLYLDQAYAPAVGQQVNDSVAELIAGEATPEQVTEAVTRVAREQ
ncbi:extracellular solute-binding protein [Streptomyces sp. TRM64462]|uniref:extracellular solute-binding protein n=1 Tax=Streptomyces sp. TRM64462 TaxID=2741726 RepID=UPI0015862811|nr:extracellular solute-binding protein [Streptomyces sp. TRM64462]